MPARTVVVLGAIAALATQAHPQATPTFPSGVELVRIDVVVLDKDGKPVIGLTAADFEVTEGGKPHAIASFEPIVVRAPPASATTGTEPSAPPRVSSSVVPVPEETRYFLIFIDDVHVSPFWIERLRSQLIRFLDAETHEGDWVTLVAPLAGLRWTARTSFERDQLPIVLKSLKGQFRKDDRDEPSDFLAMTMEEFGSPPRVMEIPGPNSSFKPSQTLLAARVYSRAKVRAHQTLASLSDALSSLAGFRGRKSLILYSEGFVKSPRVPDYDRVVELARRVGVTMWVQDPRGLGTGVGTPDGRDDGGPTLTLLDTQAGGLSFVANNTGGPVSMSNDLVAPLHAAAVESTAYYLVGFQPAAGKPGERKLKVRVRRDGLKVRAPDRYFFGEPAPSAKPILAAVEAVSRVTDATDIPLRVSTLFLGNGPKDQIETTLAVEFPAAVGETGDRQLTLLIEARPLGKGDMVHDQIDVALPPSDRPGVATRSLNLHPGVWQARVVVRDPRTEKLGSVLHTFEVPDTSALWVSSPVLSDRLERPSRPRPAIRLDQRYRPADALYCQYRVFGAASDPKTHKPRVTGSYAILRDGQAIQEGPSTPIEPAADGQFQRLMGIGLADFQAGDYTLVLRVTDEVSGQTRELREPFTVEPSQG